MIYVYIIYIRMYSTYVIHAYLYSHVLYIQGDLINEGSFWTIEVQVAVSLL